MAKGDRDEFKTDDKSFLQLKQLQVNLKETKEGTSEYLNIKAEVDRLIADRYLQYINR